jgi:hypothetical protein
VLEEIAALLGPAVVQRETVPAEHADVAWSVSIDASCRSAPLVVWAEHRGAADGPVIGIETILEGDLPSDLAVVLRIALAASPRAPWVLDVNAAARYERGQIARLIDSEPGVPAAILWSVEATERGGRARIATRGLARCGRPEIEMHGVAAPLADAAAALVDAIAAIVIDDGPPEPGAPLEVGPDLIVSLRLAEGAAERAIVCGVRPAGAGAPEWTWPRDVVERVARGEAVVYRAPGATSAPEAAP